MKQPCLYIVCGLPFSGKTTLAKILAQRLELVRIDLDQINGQFGVGLDGEAITHEQWDRTYAESYRQLGEALASGRLVIYDATNFTREQRERLRAIADGQGATTQVIYLDISEAEARRRWQQNRLTNERYDVRDEDFELVARHFEPPAQEEGAIHYAPEQPLEEWIRQTFPQGADIYAASIQALEEKLAHDIPITSHMGIQVEHYDGQCLVLAAPITPNINHKSTVFAGSLNAVLTLAGWGLTWLIVRELDISGAVAIQNSTSEYVRPVTGDFSAECYRPGAAEIAQFAKMLREKGKGRLELEAHIRQGGLIAVTFKGRYVVHVNRPA